METKDLLFEVGCEELPASALMSVANALQRNIEQGLAKSDLNFSESKLYVTPRRIAVLIKDLPVKQPPRTIERQGPKKDAAFGKDGMPTLACLGFVKSCGTTLDNLSVKETKRGEYVVCSITLPGIETKSLIVELLEKAIKQLPIPKPMRWGNNEIKFLRPVHWIVLMFGEQELHGEILGKQASNVTFGHRFLAPDPIIINRPADYEQLLLEQGKVIAGFAERRQRIQELVEKAPIPTGMALIEEDLLDEVTLLVEWPVILVGSFDKKFLKVPKEALTMSMKSHQKCFAVTDAECELEPYFIITSNIESEQPESVIHGNERVINARLSDAEFFYEQDLKTPLADNFDALKEVVFQKDLGSVADKSKRVSKLAESIAKKIDADIEVTKRAAHLSKCDLVSNMVYEFPKLQGTMGYYYALHDQEVIDCALALKQQYWPRFSGDNLPDIPVACALAIADRLDTLVGIIGINKNPTGDKDPFALRRAALGIIRIIIERSLDLDIVSLIEKAAKQHKTLPNKDVVPQCVEFINDRMKPWYIDQAFTPEIFESVRAKATKQLIDFDLRIKSIRDFVQLEEAGALAAANKRVSNILKKSEKLDIPTKADKTLFKEEAETKLYDLLHKQQKQVSSLCKKQQYAEALKLVTELKTPVDTFFDQVMIMDKHAATKLNRLALLQELRTHLNQVADISLL